MKPIDIAALREEKGWSYADLADALGTDAANAWRLERGRQVPRGRLLLALAKLLRRRPDEVLEWCEQRREP